MLKSRVEALDKQVCTLTARSKVDLRSILRVSHVKAVNIVCSGEGNLKICEELTGLLVMCGHILIRLKLCSMNITEEYITTDNELSKLENLTIEDFPLKIYACFL